MKITILNGNPDKTYRKFDNYLADYQKRLYHIGHFVKINTLREMDLHFCQGCFNCWRRTPGICSIGDDIKYIRKDVINADLVIWASPLIKGFFSGLLKKVQERMIPLLHPYDEIVNGEKHHCKRYEHYPAQGVIVEKESNTDNEDLLIARLIQELFAFNFRSDLKFILTTESPVSRAICETVSSVPARLLSTMEFEHFAEPDYAIC